MTTRSPGSSYQTAIDAAQKLADDAADESGPAFEMLQLRRAAASIALSLATLTQQIADAGLADVALALDSIASDLRDVASEVGDIADEIVPTASTITHGGQAA